MSRRAFVLASHKSDSTADLVRPIAGAPLLVRQLEWLAASGISNVTVNRVASTPLPEDLSSTELASTGVRVTWIPSARPLDCRELSARMGLASGPAAVVPHSLLGNVSLLPAFAAAETSGANIVVKSGAAEVRILHLDSTARQEQAYDGDGWMLHIDRESIAHDLVEEILRGFRPGIVVRGTEASPGIWRARGALAVEAAVLRGPCFLGPSSFVSEGAIVGPGAILGEYAIVESGARVSHARVAPGVVVGQGVVVDHALALPGRIVRHEGRDVTIDDPLLLGDQGGTSKRFSRLAAALSLGLIAPAAVIAGGEAARAVRRLSRIVEGSACWVGVRDEVDPDAVALDVLSLLVPPDARDEEVTAARALYARRKSLGLDARLLAGWLLRANRIPS